MSDRGEPGRPSASDPPPSTWYWLRGGEPVGPESFRTLVERILDGDIGADDLVWTPGREAWSPVTEVTVLGALLREETEAGSPPEDEPLPPEPPPVGSGGRVEDDHDPDETAFEEALEAADAEFLEGDPAEDAPEDGVRPLLARVTGWIEAHGGWAAGIGTALSALVVAAVLAIGAGGDGAGPPSASSRAPSPGPGSTGDEAFRSHAAALADSLAQLETADPRRDSLLTRPGDLALLLRIGFRGLRRLPDTEVVSYATTWGGLLESVSQATCERLAGWSASPEEVRESIASLSGVRRRAFLARLRRAVLAEIRGSPAPREVPTGDELTGAITTFLERVPPARADSMRGALLAGSAALPGRFGARPSPRPAAGARPRHTGSVATRGRGA